MVIVMNMTLSVARIDHLHRRDDNDPATIDTQELKAYMT